ncbi:MAG: glycosyltransferase family 2 protein [Candidatus Edwardsbacteria bacterium]|jgi:hypothetical protein|nr:glycosyltransferase family 2 protein [Candidatus Edwardsbacteria bacterium]
MDRHYDIAIAYRVCPSISKRPLAHADDKLALVRLCLRSLLGALGSLRAKMIVILDGCPPAYEELFRASFAAADLTVINTDAIGNRATFATQVKSLLAQECSEVVYVAEDDYLYLPNALVDMVGFLRARTDADFISAYDHIDLYTAPLHDHPSHICVHGGRHWRTANSTCLTFLTTKATLRRTRRCVLSFARGNDDASLWLGMTKHQLGPGSFVRHALSGSGVFRIIIKAWLYCWPYILLGSRRRLWVPMPALGTHLETTGLAPAVDWQEVIGRMMATMGRTG